MPTSACVFVCVDAHACVYVQRLSRNDFFCLLVDSWQLDHSAHPRELKEVSGL